MYADNSYNMTQTYDRKAKSEKRKAKNKKNLDFDEMNVCIWHELFDWRKTLTHFLIHSLANTHTHSLMYSDTKHWKHAAEFLSKSEKRKAKNEKWKAKNEKRKIKRILTLTKWTSAYAMSCLIDVKHSLTHFLTHSLT